MLNDRINRRRSKITQSPSISGGAQKRKLHASEGGQATVKVGAGKPKLPMLSKGLAERDVQVESVASVVRSAARQLNVAQVYLNSAIGGLVTWAGSETGAEITRIAAKLPKVLPGDWMGMPIGELDALGLGNLLRFLTAASKTPAKAGKTVDILRETVRAREKLIKHPGSHPVERKYLKEVLWPNLFLTAASATTGGLKTGKNALAIITKMGSILGLLPQDAGGYLNTGKNMLATSAARVLEPVLAYILYRDLEAINAYHHRTQALEDIRHPTKTVDLSEADEATLVDDVPLYLYMKETDPELYHLLKRVARNQSGSTLLANLGLDTMRIATFAAGTYFADQEINDVSVGTLANVAMVMISCVSLLRYKYNQNCEQVKRDTLEKWGALAPELKNPSLDERAQESLRACEKRQFIASGLIGLESFKQEGIKLNSFLIPSVADYFAVSKKSKVPDYIRIGKVVQLLKKNPEITGTYTSRQIQIAAQCLVIKPEQYRTKKIDRYLGLIHAQSGEVYRVCKGIEGMLQEKARSVSIKLDSTYAILRIYERLKTLEVENFPENHPIHAILGQDSDFFEAIRTGEVDEVTAKKALRGVLGL
jgi:hypothetical protein